MIATTIWEFLDPEWDFPEETDLEYHCVYLVLDLDRLPLYLGKAFNLSCQLYHHLMPGCALGDLVIRQQPVSLSWAVEFYTLQDCELVVARQYPGRLARFRKDLHDEGRIKYAQEQAFRALMRQLGPCLNDQANPNRQPLPEKYHIVVNPTPAYISPLEEVFKNKKNI